MRAALACLLACIGVYPAAAQSLDIEGVLGNEEGCEHLRAGNSISDLWLLLRPDFLEGAVIGCQFVEVIGAADGTQGVTGLCSHEGEETREMRRFVIASDPTDPQARLVFEDGALWDRVATCE